MHVHMNDAIIFSELQLINTVACWKYLYFTLIFVRHKVTEEPWKWLVSKQDTDKPTDALQVNDINLTLPLFAYIKRGEEITQVYLIAVAIAVIHSHVFLLILFS